MSEITKIILGGIVAVAISLVITAVSTAIIVSVVKWVW